MKEDFERVLEKIDGDGVVNLAVDLANIPSPKGREREVGGFIYDWLKANDFCPVKQEVVPERNNVIGFLKGTGEGRTLIFNSHMDTAQWGPEDIWVVGEEQRHYNHAWVEDGRVFGEGVVNDKGPMAAFFMAARAIKESGIPLKGDLILTAVVGEIGQAPIDEFQGPRYHGKGIGAKHLVDHGIWGDCALVAETTNFGLNWAEPGCSLFKITAKGRRIYTPYTPRPVDMVSSPNATVRMAKVIEAIEGWAYEYEQKNRYEFAAGTMIPKVNIGAIRSGLPYTPIVSPALCSIYLDVRIPPDGSPLAVQRELKKIIGGLGVEADIELYMFKRGYEGKNIGLLKGAIEEAHQYIFNEKPKGVTPPICSMWRDINAFNAVGIPAITYGPGVSLAGAGEGIANLAVADLITASKLYALTALLVCG